ncbi:hypothetical protein [Acutalibacter muris]|nr:hypothetical protein [Acutalibacter muris]
MKGNLAAEVKNSRDISVVFTKKKVWTSTAVSGIVVAKAEKKPLPQRRKL